MVFILKQIQIEYQLLTYYIFNVHCIKQTREHNVFHTAGNHLFSDKSELVNLQKETNMVLKCKFISRRYSICSCQSYVSYIALVNDKVTINISVQVQ